MDLRGKRALVTGASRGIGRAVATHLSQLGATTVLAARSEDALRQLADELGDAEVAVMDVADPASIQAALQGMGDIDILVANAGIAESAPYNRTSTEAWERMMAVNATSVFHLCGALVPKMVDRGWGRAVIVASNAGLTGYGYSSAYCASKHAVIGYMRAVALEIARSAVTINAVCPGWVATDMAQEAIDRIAFKTGQSAEDAQRALESMSPQRRMVEPEEVAYVTGCLCDDRARAIHGQTLGIDGGQLLK